MRYSPSDKIEIIRLVEQSHLPARRGDKELVTALVLAAAIRDGRPVRLPASLRRLVGAPS